MHLQFGLQAPPGVLSKYEPLFNQSDIFFTQALPVNNPTAVILQDSNDVYLSKDGWISAVSVILSHISTEELLYLGHQGGVTAILLK